MGILDTLLAGLARVQQNQGPRTGLPTPLPPMPGERSSAPPRPPATIDPTLTKAPPTAPTTPTPAPPVTPTPTAPNTPSLGAATSSLFNTLGFLNPPRAGVTFSGGGMGGFNAAIGGAIPPPINTGVVDETSKPKTGVISMPDPTSPGTLKQLNFIANPDGTYTLGKKADGTDYSAEERTYFDSLPADQKAKATVGEITPTNRQFIDIAPIDQDGGWEKNYKTAEIPDPSTPGKTKEVEVRYNKNRGQFEDATKNIVSPLVGFRAFGMISNPSAVDKDRNGREIIAYTTNTGRRVLFDNQTGERIYREDMSDADYQYFIGSKETAATAYNNLTGYQQGTANFDPRNFATPVRNPVTRQLENVVTMTRQTPDGMFEVISLNMNGRRLTPEEAELALAQGQPLSLGKYKTEADARAAVDTMTRSTLNVGLNDAVGVREVGTGDTKRYEALALSWDGKTLTPQQAAEMAAKGVPLSLGVFDTEEEAQKAAQASETRARQASLLVDPARVLATNTLRTADNAPRRANEKLYETKIDGQKTSVFFRDGVFRNAVTGATISDVDTKVTQQAMDDAAIAEAKNDPVKLAQVRYAIAQRKAAEAANPNFGKQKRGFWNALRAMGYGALMGFAKGGIGGAIGGALTGGIIGSFDATFDDFLKNEMFTKPRTAAELKAAQDSFKFIQERMGEQADIQGRIISNIQGQATARKTDAETAKLIAESHPLYAVLKDEGMSWADIQAYEDGVTAEMIRRGLLKPGERFRSGLRPFTLGNMVDAGVHPVTGERLFRHGNSNILVPARMMGSDAPLRYQSQAEGVLILAGPDGKPIVLRGTNENLSNIAANLLQWNAGKAFDATKFKVETELRVREHNSQALNTRANAILQAHTALARSEGQATGTYTAANAIYQQISAKQAELQTLETAQAGGARLSTADEKKMEDLRKEIYGLQTKYMEELGKNAEALQLSGELRTLIDQQKGVVLLEMPDIQINAPAIQLTQPNPAAPPVQSNPGSNYRAPRNRDTQTENVIGSNLQAPVNPRNRRNISA